MRSKISLTTVICMVALLLSGCLGGNTKRSVTGGFEQRASSLHHMSEFGEDLSYFSDRVTIEYARTLDDAPSLSWAKEVKAEELVDVLRDTAINSGSRAWTGGIASSISGNTATSLHTYTFVNFEYQPGYLAFGEGSLELRWTNVSGEWRIHTIHLSETMTTGRVTVGQIKGTVKNQSGYPVANATVLLDGRQAKTTIHGEFAFEEISPGMYWISIKPPNDHLYNDVRQVPLNAGETRLLDIVLDFKIPSTSDRYTYYLLNNTDMYLKLEFPVGVEIWADDNNDGWFEPDEIIRITATPGQYDFKSWWLDPTSEVRGPGPEGTIWIYKQRTNGHFDWDEESQDWVVYTE